MEFEKKNNFDNVDTQISPKCSTVGISVIKNEEDILEIFIRHNLNFLDLLLLIDNGSTDNSRTIINKLIQQGLNVCVIDDNEMAHAQANKITNLYRRVCTSFFPDFVVPLDADELIQSQSKQSFMKSLKTIPINGIGIYPWKTYIPEPIDNVNFKSKFQYRRIDENPQYYKIILNTCEGVDYHLKISQGSHGVIKENGNVHCVKLSDICLAHFPVRNCNQILKRALLGWLANVKMNKSMDSRGQGYQKHDLYKKILNGEKFSDRDLTYIALNYAQKLNIQNDWKKYVKLDPPIIKSSELFCSEMVEQDDQHLNLLKIIILSWQNQLLEDQCLIADEDLIPFDQSMNPLISSGNDHNSDGISDPKFHLNNLFIDIPPFQYIYDRFLPKEVLDIGCGTGQYLRLLKKLGVKKIIGIDGFTPEKSFLGSNQYRCHNLTLPLNLSCKFDLVLCLEVAEHLPPGKEDVLIETLNNHASNILIFSAGEIGQPGIGHINCQPFEYWAQLLHNQGWRPMMVETLFFRCISSYSCFRRNPVVLKKSAISNGSFQIWNKLISISKLPYKWYSQKPQIISEMLKIEIPFGVYSTKVNKLTHRRFHSARHAEIQRCKDTQKDAQPDKNVVCDIIKRVKLYQRKEEYDKGVTLLAKTINHYPSTQSLRESLCELLIEVEQYDDAIGTLKEIGKGRWSLHSFELMATILEKSKEYDKLEKELACASFLGYQSAILSNLKGAIEYSKKNMGTAISYFGQAMNLDHRYGLAYVNCGLVKIENGDVDSGLALLEEGFSRTPCDHTVLESYHSVISEFGDYRGADQLFQQAVQENPACKKLNYLYTDILLQQKKYAEAISVIERAIATFGVQDGILGPALAIREKIGTSSGELDSGGQRISLCMIVKNEEANLAKCLISVKSLVDEIIVVDTGSTDHTKEIANVFGASVFDFSWNDNFSDARNASLSNAKGNWILILDADEQISGSDHEAIRQQVAGPQDRSIAYSFTTRNYCNDAAAQGWIANNADYPEERGGGWYPSVKVRLFPNLTPIYFENIVHETVEKSLIREKIKIRTIDVPIHHFGDLDRVKKRRKKERYYQLGKKKLSTQKDNLKCLIENAIQAGEVNDYQRATEIWKTVLGKAPNYAKGFFNLGYAYIQLGQYKQAMRVSRKAIELDPELKEAFLNLALCEMRTGNLRNAIHILEHFLAHYPNHPVAVGNLGVAYCLSGNEVAGVAYIQRIAGMGFNGREFIDQHIRDLKIAGQPERAAALLSASLSLFSSHSLSGVVA